MSTGVYDMMDLLALIESEHAEGLILNAGSPPVVLLRGEQHPIEGPSITADNAESMFRTFGDTSQIRELRSKGAITLLYSHKGSRFRVQARSEDGVVSMIVDRMTDSESEH